MLDRVLLAASQRTLIGQLDRKQGAALMTALDACNARFGQGAVVPTRAGWSTKFEMRTPRYTMRIDELPVALA